MGSGLVPGSKDRFSMDIRRQGRRIESGLVFYL